jgi:hypothetical protein
MGKAMNSVASCALVLLTISFAHGQKRGTKGVPTKQLPPRTVCKGQPVPRGFVIIGNKVSEKCGENSELVIKKPTDTEIVCDSSPIPEGYRVISQQGSAACLTPNSNPLTNALSIAREGVTALPQAPTRSTTTTVYRSQPTRKPNSTSDESNNAATESQSRSARPSREEIEIAVRRATVIIGMEMQDVSRAWGNPRTNDKLIEEDGLIHIWGYAMGRVYFRNGIVYKIELLKGH